MIVDSSALMAILFNEDDAPVYAQALISSITPPLICAGTYVEASIVVDRNPSPILAREFDRLISTSKIEIVPLTEQQAILARHAYRQFGRGSGSPARLNFGDCFAYALASERDEPLLYKGDDFGHTDVRSALDQR